MVVDMEQALDAILSAIAAEEGKLAPKKALLVRAAVVCFSENGFAATSTAMIARKAEVAEATIFRHFKTKRELLFRITEPVVKRILAPAISSEAKQLQTRASGDLAVFMRSIMLSRLRFADQYAPLVRIVLQEILVDSEMRSMILRYATPVIQGAAIEAIGGYRRAGQIKDIAVERLLRMMISLLLGYYLTRSIVAPDDWDDEVEVEIMVQTVLHGLTPH